MHTPSFRSLIILARVPLSLSVTFTAFTSYTVFAAKLNPKCIVPLSAVFFLAAGASVINQVQEKKTDALMDRTKGRPVASGRIQPGPALAISLFCLVSGIMLFVFSGSWIALFLGIGNVAWYNGVYTPLKKKTTFALLPGAVTGAIPVFIGWSSAGGNILDTDALVLGLFMFCWQMPHFWLLMLARDKEFRTAGIPVMTDHFTFFQVKRMIVAWLFAASVTSLILVTGGFSHHHVTGIVVLILNFILLMISIYRFFIGRKEPFRFLFILVNCFLFMVLLLLISSRLLPG